MRFVLSPLALLFVPFAIAAPQRADLRLVLALSMDGDRARIVERVQALPADVRAKVRIEGLVPVASVLKSIDALVLPYRSLATTTVYPSLLLEADVAACPVVVGGVDGLKGVLDYESRRCFVFPPRDVHELARTLLRVRDSWELVTEDNDDSHVRVGVRALEDAVAGTRRV